MINILTFTPVWQRPEIFSICLDGIARLVNHDKTRFNIRPFFMISESWAAVELLKRGYEFIYTQNDPLGAKKNAGLDYVLKNISFDYILEIGSDDLIASSWLDKVEPLLLQSVAQIHPSTCYFIDILTGTAAVWYVERVLGAGRFISRAAIKKALQRGAFWEEKGRRGMDTYSWRQLQNVGIGNTMVKTKDVTVLDIKSDVNINHIAQMHYLQPSPRTIDEILIHFPESDLIRSVIASAAKQSI